MSTTNAAKPRLGVALGGGSARGWAHIGVLRALAEQGMAPDIVCGASVGALVGGIYAAGRLAELEEWVCALTRRDVFALVDFTMSGGGPIRGDRLMEFYRQQLGDILIEELPLRYAAVATDLQSGAEVWLQQGPLLAAVRASISIPGIFAPTQLEERWLADGALVNPVPVNLCRALGADVVIAVELNRHLFGRWRSEEVQPAVVNDRTWLSRLARFWPGGDDAEDDPAAREPAPRYLQVVLASLDIMQDRIARSRLAGDPPDLLLTPRVQHVDPLGFAGGRPTIDEGYESVRRMLPALQHLLDRA